MDVSEKIINNQVIEVSEDGKISIPFEIAEALNLKKGTKLKLFTDNEELLIVKKISPLSWEGEYSQLLEEIGKQTEQFSESEVLEDITKAIKEVRKSD
jgi:AbrB family looped-hinge helix DNA binding protein